MQENLIVAILNNQKDFSILRDQLWYRIPVESVEKFLKDRWPPKWMAFYQSGIFKKYAFMINHYGMISDISIVTRMELFPDEKVTSKSDKKYYKISFNKLETLPKPILSRRWRRIIFIRSTYSKFLKAVEINDLFDESPLEDKLWAEFKRIKIQAERQELVQIQNRFYFLDFAIYCRKGDFDIETDGDEYHLNSKKAIYDNIRNNDVTALGWGVLRFTSDQINEKMQSYCIPHIVKQINNLGGVQIDEYFSKRFDEFNEDGNYQYDFFDYAPEE